MRNKEIFLSKKCIYCGNYFEIDELTDEHIIPLGLNGDMILHKSSCKNCAKITGAKIEQEVLRNMFLQYRTHKNFRTRKPKNRPKKLTIGRFRDDNSFERFEALEIKDHPDAVCLPIFGVPTFFAPGNERSGIELIGSSVYNLNDISEKLKNRKNAAYVQMFHPEMFCRMLAKIAHSFVCKEIGIDKFRPYLSDFILNGSGNMGRFIGSWMFSQEKSGGTHDISIIRIERTIVVLLTLFADISAPTYAIVVGELL